MSLHDRVNENPTICGVELGFGGELKPSTVFNFQRFSNSIMVNNNFTETYISLGGVSFGEESDLKPAGFLYKQTVSFRFPATDQFRSERLELMTKVRFLKLKLSNGLDLVIGRNDFNQNARPKISIKSNLKIGEIEFTTVSIFPVGFVLNPSITNNQQIPLLIYGH